MINRDDLGICPVDTHLLGVRVRERIQSRVRIRNGTITILLCSTNMISVFF